VDSVPTEIKEQIIRQFVGEKVEQLNLQLEKCKLERDRLGCQRAKQEELSRQFLKEK
jgi:hypothetical protein